MPEFRIYCLSGEFMTSLVASLFPWPDNSDTGGNEEEFKVGLIPFSHCPLLCDIFP